MDKEEIEKRIDFCEKKARDYREIGKNFIANKYDEEKYKWEKLLSDLDLLEKRKINELLEYKKGYYKQKEVIDKAIEWVKDWMQVKNDWFEEDSKPSELLDILKGGSNE